MIVIGLTGSIAMGKSTAAGMLRRRGVPVFDADAAVHRLQAPGSDALTAIEAAFPGTTGPGGLDRTALAARVFGHPAALARLERIMHPRVAAAQTRWLGLQARRRARIVVLDVPLLFERGGWRHCDLIAVVSAPAAIQRQRVLRRPGMTPDRFAAILRLQLPDAEKRRRADVVLPSGRGRHAMWRAIGALLERARTTVPRHYPPGLPGARLVNPVARRYRHR